MLAFRDVLVRTVVALTFALAPKALAAGPTPVSGDIGADVTWLAAESPYVVTDTVRVLAGVTLVIEPGVDVLFDADVPFIVEGGLFAGGTQTDSIRLMAGSAPEWGGLRFGGFGLSALIFARVSDGNADGPTPYQLGGGVYTGDFAFVDLIDAVISSNRASFGGGVYVGDDSFLTTERCTIANNTAAGDGGGLLVQDPATAILYKTLVVGNASAASGGGLWSASVLVVENCTIVGNSSSFSGGATYFWTDNNDATFSNVIAWGNSSPAFSSVRGAADLSYSDLQGGFAGTGNINTDPLFVGGGDYSLQPGSPCIDAGDPTSMLDPDGTISDMGAIFHDQGAPMPDELSLPVGSVSVVPGDEVIVAVRATTTSAYSFGLVFTVDASILEPDTSGGMAFIDGDAFTDNAIGASKDWNIVGDTVRVTLAAPTTGSALSLNEEVLVDLAFNVKAGVLRDTTVQLAWVSAETNIDEVVPGLNDGAISLVSAFGDVTFDGNVSAFDAAKILEFVVRKTTTIDFVRADVTDNGSIAAFDAAFVLGRVVNPSLLFPVQNPPLTKPTPRGDRVVTWVAEGSGLSLVVNDPTGIESGELLLRLADDTSVGALSPSGNQVTVSHQTGTILRAAFARPDMGERVLLRIEGDSPLSGTPVIEHIQLNEGQITVADIDGPERFALAQNAPNPFNPTTNIRFTIAQNGVVNLVIYDATGRHVRTLVAGRVEAGRHEITWDGRDAAGREVASGMYVYRLTTGEQVKVRAMTLVR